MDTLSLRIDSPALEDKPAEISTGISPQPYQGCTFRWEEYLKKTESVAAPASLFPHVVEKGSKALLEKDMIVEVQRENENQVQFWPAIVKLVCGPISKLEYVGGEELGAAAELWGETSKLNIFPLRTAKEDEYLPPDCIRELRSDWRRLLYDTLEENPRTLQKPILKGTVKTDFDDYLGMVLLIRDEVDPFTAWYAAVTSSSGGFLELSYLLPPGSVVPDLGVFYTSQRILDYSCLNNEDNPLLIEVRNPHWIFRPPQWGRLAGQELELGQIDHDVRLQIRRRASNPSFHKPDSSTLTKHIMSYGLFVEGISPLDPTKISACQVTEVIDDYYFKIAMLEVDASGKVIGIDRSTDRWHTADSARIFPAGWAKIHHIRVTARCRITDRVIPFEWPEGSVQLSTPQHFPVIFPCAKAMGFEVGMKLEFPHKGDLCIATVSGIADHILLIQVDSEPRSFKMLVPVSSTRLFPLGWSESNDLVLVGPREEQVDHDKQQPVPEEDYPSDVLPADTQTSMWCPSLYFNHKCYTGNHVASRKFSALPRTIGPGPVSLVVRELISLLISASGNPRWLLRELQTEKAPQDMHLEVFKAKTRNGTAHASVALASSTSSIPGFLKSILEKLKCCPNLVSFVQAGDPCQDICENMRKAYWLHRKYLNIGRSYLKTYVRLRNEMLKAEPSDSKLRLFFTNLEGESRDGRQENLKKTSDSGDKKIRLNPRIPLFVSEITTRKKRIDLKTLGNLKSISPEEEEHPKKKKKDDGAERPRKLRATVSRSPKKSFGPVIETIDLESNPLFWSPHQVASFLRSHEFSEQADHFLYEEVDGHAFLLMNLPTLLEHTKLSLEESVRLCHLVERALITYYEKFIDEVPSDRGCQGAESHVDIISHAHSKTSDLTL